MINLRSNRREDIERELFKLDRKSSSPSRQPTLLKTGPSGIDGRDGKDGIDGNDGASDLTIKGIAGEALSGNRVVYKGSNNKIFYADKDDETSTYGAFGLTNSSVSLDSEATIVFNGEMTDSSFTYAINTIIYLSDNGNISNIAPTSGFVLVVGKQTGTNTIFIDFGTPFGLI